MQSAASKNPGAIISRLVVIGINYRHASVTERSLFSITSDDSDAMLKEASEKGIRSLFILSTCNRSELYAYCHDENDLVSLLVDHTKGPAALFQKVGFVKKGEEALDHLFRVASGLDSQIIGDFEIPGQLKAAVAFSRGRKMIGPVMDRSINFALQASKSVRTNTNLSAGTVSVSYAAIEWLKKIDDVQGKKILLSGVGKLGTTLAKNLKHYFPEIPVTIINRTDEKANLLANSLSFSWKPFPTFGEEVKLADIIIVCTNAPGYMLTPQLFPGLKEQWILDLSIPVNTDPAIKNISLVTVTGVDEVSREMKEALAKRNSEIPKALDIIEHHKQEFYEWLQLQRHVALINEVKDKLYELGELHFPGNGETGNLSSRVNKTVGSLAMNLRYKREKGCHYINAINDFLQPDPVHE